MDVPILNPETNWTSGVTGKHESGRLVGLVELHLRNVQKSANYTCIASSTLKTIDFTTTVHVLARPKVFNYFYLTALHYFHEFLLFFDVPVRYCCCQHRPHTACRIFFHFYGGYTSQTQINYILVNGSSHCYRCLRSGVRFPGWPNWTLRRQPFTTAATFLRRCVAQALSPGYGPRYSLPASL